jgi:hypothetical protein
MLSASAGPGWFPAFVCALGVISALAATTPAAALPPPLEIKILSNRADLVSGGDALVEIVVPAKVATSAVTVDVDGRDVTGAFAVRPNGRVIGLLEGLVVGNSVVTARAKGAMSARITIRNHPNGGPVFSGAQVQPWFCETEANGFGPPQDAQCNVPAKYEFFYRPTTGGSLAAYDPAEPPSDVAMTTTDQGHTVPFIVRRETGVMNRGWYSIAVLFNPAEPWEPWAAQRGWNGKVTTSFGGSSSPDHFQNSPPSVLDAARLGAGFMVAASSLNTQGQNINDVVHAEALMMWKERIVERYGEIRYVISDGCSGGSSFQHLLANAYPGLVDGIQPSCSYADARSTGSMGEAPDCVLLNRYFTQTSPHLWTVEQQQAAAAGHASASVCLSWQALFGPNLDPRTNNCGASSHEPWQYHPETNPEGERCLSEDFQVAIWGYRTPDVWEANEQRIGRGFARLPRSSEGLQYGLVALQSGLILPEQFVDLNEKIGGRDIDYNWIPDRTRGDLDAFRIAYSTGRVVDGTRLKDTPIIDLRGHDNVEIHTDFNSWSMKERLLRANGHADNHVVFTSGAPLVPLPSVAAEAFALMDRWLAAIEADTSGDPLDVKVVRNKPAGAVDSCYVGEEKITDKAKCRQIYPYFGNVKIAAGAPFTNHYLKCQLKPLHRVDYLPVTFTDEQWGRLQKAFPTGVCDWNRPPFGEVPSEPWVTFEDGPGLGRPLGPPPVSTPFVGR